MSKSTKKSNEKLDAVLPPIRCTKDEKQIIKQKADHAHLSLSGYIRQVATTSQIILVESQINYDAVEQLRKIGVNLNQQTRRLNATGKAPLQLVMIWDRLELALDQLNKSL